MQMYTSIAFANALHTMVVLSKTGRYCPVNIKIAEKLHMQHVGCMSHKIHLEIYNMINRDIVQKQLLESIGDVTRQCKPQLKN